MRILLFITLTILCGSINAQTITFFEDDQTNFGGSISHETPVLHELIDGGFVHGYRVKNGTHWDFKYGLYDEYGYLKKALSPSIPYGDPQIEFSASLPNKQLFITGGGESSNGNKLFSHCLDSLGKVVWEYNDSMSVLRLLIESDTNYFGILGVHRNTVQYPKGYHLVRMKHDGSTYWSKPYTDLYKQLSTDSSFSTPVIISVDKWKNKFVFHLMSSATFEHNRIVAFNERFDLIGEYFTNYATDFLSHDGGVIIDANLGTPSYSRYKILNVDWSFNAEWEIIADTGVLSSLTNGGLTKIGSNWCFNVKVTDSSWVNWLDYYMSFYDFKGTKTRECRYNYPNRGFQYSARGTTSDKGMILYARPDHWVQHKVGMLKTDSLGLVYNTDVVCDCKDFNVGVEPQHKAFSSEDVKLFPNPASSKLNVLLAHKQEGVIEVIGINGQPYLNQSLEFNSNILDVSSLSTGVYFVRVRTQEITVTKKFVVAR